MAHCIVCLVRLSSGSCSAGRSTVKPVLMVVFESFICSDRLVCCSVFNECWLVVGWVMLRVCDPSVETQKPFLCSLHARSLGNKTAAAFGDLLESSHTLKELDLSWNQIKVRVGEWALPMPDG